MLYKVEVENFYSVREAQVLDLTIGANVPDPDGRFLPIFPGSEQRAPKVVAIYGANASGKTTILRALQFVAAFILNSASPHVQGIRLNTFNDDESNAAPTRIAVEMGAVMNPLWEKQKQPAEYGTLRYELLLQAKDGLVGQVVSETLMQRPQGKGKWVRVFERFAGGKIQDSSTFKLAGFRHLANTLTETASIISSFAFFNHPAAEFYAEVARGVFTNLGLMGDHVLMQYLHDTPHVLEKLNRDLNRIDVGVEALRIENLTSAGPQGRFQHAGHRRELPWEMESQGTQAFVRLFPLLFGALDAGGLALVDEFDTLIHPLVLPEILRWFYDDDARNAAGAQMWMSCHSATLLEYLVKEEVVFAEKDLRGRTSVYSLTDVSSMDDKEPVRRTANLYKKYLSGAFGAVPVIG